MSIAMTMALMPLVVAMRPDGSSRALPEADICKTSLRADDYRKYSRSLSVTTCLCFGTMLVPGPRSLAQLTRTVSESSRNWYMSLTRTSGQANVDILQKPTLTVNSNSRTVGAAH